VDERPGPALDTRGRIDGLGGFRTLPEQPAAPGEGGDEKYARAEREQPKPLARRDAENAGSGETAKPKDETDRDDWNRVGPQLDERLRA
jgi:hypothetical protein